MTQAAYFIAVALVAVLFALYLAYSQPKPLEAPRKHGTVEYVYDGDTIILDGMKERIRLWVLMHRRKTRRDFTRLETGLCG